MTARWGPLGWITLHSISAAYPDSPTQSDKSILNLFLDRFAQTITCPSCKGHFSSMFSTYKAIHPDWADSKFNFFVAVCRMHNTVNKRLDKPIPKTLDECISVLKNATAHTNTVGFRKSYIEYVISNWARQGNGDGFILASAAREMLKINNNYWNPRDVSFSDLTFLQDADVLEFVPENPEMYKVSQGIPVAISHPTRVGFRITGGKLRLGGR